MSTGRRAENVASWAWLGSETGSRRRVASAAAVARHPRDISKTIALSAVSPPPPLPPAEGWLEQAGRVVVW